MPTEGSESRPAKGGGGAPNPPEPNNVQCPRCESSDTKFCYYNNYNLGQPRYLCKSCHRYWTRGGCLRRVPVGGRSRKRPRSDAPPLPPPPVPAAAPDTTSWQSSELVFPGSFTALLFTEQEDECEIGLGYGPGASLSVFDGFGKTEWPLNVEAGENTWQTEGGGVMVDGEDCFGWPNFNA